MSAVKHSRPREVIGGRGPLSASGRKLIGDTRELLEAILQIGDGKESWVYLTPSLDGL